MKIRTKISLLLAPIIVTSLLLLGVLAYGQLIETNKQRVFAQMQSVLFNLQARTRRAVSTARANAILFGKDTLVKKYVLTEDEDLRFGLLQGPLLSLFNTFQEAFPDYYEIRILRPDAHEDARQTRPYTPNRSEEEADTPFFRALAAVPAGGGYEAIQDNPDNGELALYAGKPLLFRDNSYEALSSPPRLRGYLVLTARLSGIQEYIRTTLIGKQGFLFATDARGHILLKNPSSRLDDKDSNALADALRNGNTVISPVKVAIAGQTHIVMGVSASPDFRMFAALPENEFAETRYRLGINLFLVTLVTIVTMLIAIGFSLEWQVLRPVEYLTGVTRSIGQGDLSIKLGALPTGEFGELAKAFSAMAKNLSRSHDEIKQLAFQDQLTGLWNRTRFMDIMDHAIADAKRHGEQFALLFLDLDNFKQVNDNFGHPVGDLLLQRVAELLSESVRKTDTVSHQRITKEIGGGDSDWTTGIVSRLGGDEFIVMLPRIQDPDTPSSVAQRIIKVLSKPIVIGEEHECHVGCSIGITIYPMDAETNVELIKNADIAMYHAKGEGKNTWRYYRDSLNEEVVHRLHLETRLRQAIDKGGLHLDYQPQFSATSGKIIGLEALARWTDPEEGVIPPGTFIPIAERSGLILSLGEWVLNQACKQGVLWRNANLPRVRIAINVSAVQFAHQDFPKLIREALDNSGLEPQYLQIEITESVMINNFEQVTKMFSQIRRLGVTISMDDFGSGYSSLSYLRHLPLQEVKIDRGFIKQIDSNQQDAEIVSAIVSMAHTMKLRVVAEGIETQKQLAIVHKSRCDAIQGFLAARPLSVSGVSRLIAKQGTKGCAGRQAQLATLPIPRGDA